MTQRPISRQEGAKHGLAGRSCRKSETPPDGAGLLTRFLRDVDGPALGPAALEGSPAVAATSMVDRPDETPPYKAVFVGFSRFLQPVRSGSPSGHARCQCRCEKPSPKEGLPTLREPSPGERGHGRIEKGFPFNWSEHLCPNITGTPKGQAGSSRPKSAGLGDYSSFCQTVLPSSLPTIGAAKLGCT